MKITAERNEATGDFVLHIRVTKDFVAQECEVLPLNVRDLITGEKSRDIIEDAVLMAMGLERRRA